MVTIEYTGDGPVEWNGLTLKPGINEVSDEAAILLLNERGDCCEKKVRSKTAKGGGENVK